jgi:glyoxylase-like metal-dependent hydrolase (beta-lactamase superfamily II)
MRTLMGFGFAIAVSLACSSCGVDPLNAAAENLGVEDVTSIRFDGTGANFSVGQPFAAGNEWPQVNIVSYDAVVDYEAGAMQVDMVREQPQPEPMGGGVRFAGQQRTVQAVSGTSAWNQPPPAADGTQLDPQPQPAAAVERGVNIWTTPHGFVKAAIANAAVVTETEEGGEVAFTLPSGNRVNGTINAEGEVTRVQTWVDNPVLGDMLVETTYSDYQEFEGIRFPTRIMQSQGGQPALDLTIRTVTPNAPANIAVPANVVGVAAAPVAATSERVAPGVFYIKGGSHHSVAIEMADHIVVVEGPQSEARAAAVIEAAKAAIPNKPIRYIVNTHVHFDHSGGLRPFVAEGATVVTHETNQQFYEQAWAAPRTLNADRLATAGGQPTFMTVGDEAELTDGRRTIEIHRIQDSPHAIGFLMVWLPAERILIEADAYTPGAAGAPVATPPAVNTVNLHDNVVRLGLQPRQILALHGPRIATLADLRAAAGR